VSIFFPFKLLKNVLNEEKRYLKLVHGIEIVAFVASVGHVSMEPMSVYPGESAESEWLGKWNQWWSKLDSVARADVDSNEVRCPDSEIADKMRQVCFSYLILKNFFVFSILSKSSTL
jgi:hypothetical protein